jgi:tRNA A-37 threonylcarbamoyl transferase component Bud32/ligand-binding sensor domain-containing protein
LKFKGNRILLHRRGDLLAAIYRSMLRSVVLRTAVPALLRLSCFCLFALYGCAVAASEPLLRFFADAVQPIAPLAIAEDANGDLWIAAREGIFRFDGYRFIRIPGDFHGQTSIAVVGGHTILIGATNGLFQYRDGLVLRISPEAATTLIKLTEEFVLIYRQASTRQVEAGEWDGTKLVLYPQREPAEFPWLSAGGALWQMCGSFPCSLQNTPELREATRRGEFRQYQVSRSVPLKSVPIGHTPNFFISGAKGSYFSREANGAVVNVMRPGRPTLEYRVGGFKVANWGPQMYWDRQGRIWVPGDDLWLAEGSTFQRFKSVQLDGKQVTCVFEDSGGRLWFGINGNGLGVMGMEPVSESWASPPSFGEINAITRTNSATLLAATIKGDLLGKQGDAEWKSQPVGDNAPRFSQVAASPQGALMGLIRMGPPARLSAEGQVLRQVSLPSGTQASSLRRLVSAPDGSFFVGSQEHPQGVYKIAGDRMERVRLPKLDGIEVGNAQDIVFDSQGKAVVAFQGGVCRVEGIDCRVVISLSDGLLSPNLRGVELGPAGETWVAYRDVKAFSRFRVSDHHWVARHFTEKDGFEEPETMFLRHDRRGWIWRGSGEGLWVCDGMHVEPGDWIQITEKDGLPSRNINRFGFFEDEDGSVWIGTAAGIAHLKPSASWFAAKHPARISAMTFGQSSFVDRALFPGAFQSPGQLTARFADSDLLPIRYRLLPRDADWHVDRSGEAHYDKLRVGNYRFQATSGQGNAIAEYPFEVTDPARTEAWAAGIGGFALTGIAVFAGFRASRKRRKEREQKALPDLAEWRLAALVPEVQDLLGTTLDGRFMPHNVVARGGFGIILDGLDLQENRRCAIKIFRKEFAEEWRTRRFQHEVAALETIFHPNVVRIYGHGATPAGMPYLVMEFIEGQTLRDLLKRGALPPTKCATLLRQAGNALEEIHSSGIFHRDVKPENIMIRSEGTAGHDLVLIDFSTAIVKDPDRTMHGFSNAIGTMHYMAPEQAAGFSGVASDIYSFAKVAIEIVTGERVSALFPDALLDLPERVNELLSELPLGLSRDSTELISSALEFDPKHRPKSAALFARQIAADLDAFSRET